MILGASRKDTLDVLDVRLHEVAPGVDPVLTRSTNFSHEFQDAIFGETQHNSPAAQWSSVVLTDFARASTSWVSNQLTIFTSPHGLNLYPL